VHAEKRGTRKKKLGRKEWDKGRRAKTLPPLVRGKETVTENATKRQRKGKKKIPKQRSWVEKDARGKQGDEIKLTQVGLRGESAIGE